MPGKKVVVCYETHEMRQLAMTVKDVIGAHLIYCPHQSAEESTALWRVELPRVMEFGGGDEAVPEPRIDEYGRIDKLFLIYVGYLAWEEGFYGRHSKCLFELIPGCGIGRPLRGQWQFPFSLRKLVYQVANPRFYFNVRDYEAAFAVSGHGHKGAGNSRAQRRKEASEDS